MKQLGLVVLFLLWTMLVVGGTLRWVHRKDDRLADETSTKADPIDVSVDPHLKLEDDRWMLSSLRMTRGAGVNVRREELPGGGIRVVATDANTFGGDTVTIDLTKAPGGSIQGMAKVDWERDMGPPFAGSWRGVMGGIQLSSSDLANAHPLIIEFTFHEKGGDYPGCEHGVVSVP